MTQHTHAIAEVEVDLEEEETEGDLSTIRHSLSLPLSSDAMDMREYVRMNSFRAYAPMQSGTP